MDIRRLRVQVQVRQGPRQARLGPLRLRLRLRLAQNANDNQFKLDLDTQRLGVLGTTPMVGLPPSEPHLRLSLSLTLRRQDMGATAW